MTDEGPAPVIIVGHGGFPDGLRDAAEMIVGHQEAFATVSLQPADDPGDVADKVDHVLEELGVEASGDALLFADLFGGSPSNAAVSLLQKRPNLEVLAGVNLAMTIEILADRTGSASELARKALEAGRDSVVDAGTRIREALRGRAGGDG